MALFEKFGGKENDLTEIKIRKGVLGVSLQSDTNYPGAATSEKILNLGVFENNTVKLMYSSTKSIKIHTGTEKVLSMMASIEGTGVSQWSLSELQEILDQTQVTIYLFDVESYYSNSNFDLTSKFVPDNTAILTHAILSNTQLTLYPESQDKEVTRIKIMGKSEDTAANLSLDFIEKVYTVGGTDPWLTIFGDNFLDSYIDSNTPDKNFLLSLRSMCHMFWDFTRTNALTQDNSLQRWDHENTTLVAGGNAVYDTDHYELGNGATGILSETTSAVSTGRRFGYLILDGAVASPSNEVIFRYDADAGATTEDGFLINVVDSDTFQIIATFAAGTGDFSISSGNITGENFADRATRIFLLDFETETIYYYNQTKNIFTTVTNGASNTVTFTSSGNGVFIGSDMSSNKLDVYKLGYAIW